MENSRGCEGAPFISTGPGDFAVCGFWKGSYPQLRILRTSCSAGGDGYDCRPVSNRLVWLSFLTMTQSEAESIESGEVATEEYAPINHSLIVDWKGPTSFEIRLDNGERFLLSGINGDRITATPIR